MIPERVAYAASLLFLLVAPFAASGGIRATCLIAAVIAILLSGAWKTLVDPGAPRTTFALVAAWFVLAPLSLAWTRDTGHTLAEIRAESFYGILAFVAFFALAASDPRRWPRWWIALVAGALLAFVAKALQKYAGLALWRHSPDGGTGPFSTHLVLLAPLLVALVATRPWGFRSRPATLALALAILFGVAWATRESWMTPNRIVWPSLAVVFLVAVAAARKARLVEPDTIPGIRRVVVAGGIAIALAFIASIAAKNERYYRDHPGFAPSVEHDLRPRVWSLGWAQWRDAPVLGHGFGREIRGPVFLPETPVGVDHPPLQHAHNALVNIAMQLGVVGLVLFVAVLAAFARNYASLLAHPGTAALGVIGLALLGGFVTKNLTDDFFHRHNAQVFWALNGMLLGFARRRKD